MAAAGGAGSQGRSAFRELGLKKVVQSLVEEIQELYLWDRVPWVVGYSGGKDSSAIMQLVWMALAQLPAEKRSKPVHVISTDTLVEQPVVAAWVDASHERMRVAAREQDLPIQPHKLTPDVEDSFWVNLIGRGYPAPRKKFRWCTERMKIRPSNKFIRSMVRQYGEAILVLGTRKAESQQRALRMEQHEKRRVRERLAPNASLPNSLVYTPVEDWSNDDVWLFLMQFPNPWGHTNKSLLGMYQGASTDGECPLVVDTSTPSCGSSRFGCWVCTVVDKDRSMEAMIKNDEEKVWMTPLLAFRNELGDFANERERRDYRRMNGRVQLFHDSTVPGPYRKQWREHWLDRLLTVQEEIRRLGPPEVQQIELISMDELREIRRIWLYEKHEFDDALPRIFERTTGREFPTDAADDALLRRDDWELLKDVCGGDDAFFELQRTMLDVEREYRGMMRRAGIFDALTDRLRAGQFPSESEAIRLRSDEEERRGGAGGTEPGGDRQKTMFVSAEAETPAPQGLP
ncbi:MAG: DNA phosphorothioation system sulfurtransferase DndC [Planctomycetaceae bacterium]